MLELTITLIVIYTIIGFVVVSAVTFDMHGEVDIITAFCCGLFFGVLWLPFFLYRIYTQGHYIWHVILMKVKRLSK